MVHVTMGDTLDQETIIERLAEVEGWEQDGAWLVTAYEFDDFAEALAFVNTVGEIAEELNHHPDITLHDYSTVTLAITSHDAGGITDRDFTFVDRVEAAADEF